MNYIKSLLLIVLLLFGLTDGLYGQQDAQYTQYMYNTISVNPAYAGSRGQLSITALYRSQWLGLKGAPETQTLNLHSPIRKGGLGYGFSIINDNIGNGVVQETQFDAILSYTIGLSKDSKLSFGLKAGGNLLNLDFTELNNYTSENVQGENIDNKFSPNFGVGVYYHTDQFYVGLSVPNLVETQHFDNSQRDANSVQFLSTRRMNFYLISGYVFDLNAYWKFKPAVLSKIVGGAPLQLDLSANFFYKNQFSFGVAYRWDAALSALVGFQINDKIMIGLAYDREITELGGTRFNDGSFEIFLRFELKKKSGGQISPRFF
ncbi:PorP/SprF family type IX secretion system membrane protein [Arenibacter latericius]|uniref:PorP/SprF family type IX secretion system membrane protein n=1 Tax=Arenibacter latericius TaxID=86104 RepID=UPI0004070923|nr:type IX secretion system membrane protein PorP/SprF [Arenibacter latericius]